MGTTEMTKDELKTLLDTMADRERALITSYWPDGCCPHCGVHIAEYTNARSRHVEWHTGIIELFRATVKALTSEGTL